MFRIYMPNEIVAMARSGWFYGFVFDPDDGIIPAEIFPSLGYTVLRNMTEEEFFDVGMMIDDILARS
uniref:Uncharacterized protein n=1 Tax=viral metagenome TaxID=1070528 RepID=A0A6M3L588_9ZZZZ